MKTLKEFIVGTVTLLIIGYYIWFFIGPQKTVHVEDKMKEINSEVAEDIRKQLSSAIKSGDRGQVCHYLGAAAAAYNQAHDEQNYLEMIKQKNRLCK